MQHDHDHDDDDVERGFAFDVQTMSRRRALLLLGGAGAGALAIGACSSSSESGAPTSSVSTGGSTGTTAGTTAPAATSGSTTSVAGSTATTATSAAATTAASADTAATVADVTEEIPDETAGPFPGDGTNGPNVLVENGVVRSDITTSVGGAAGVADGIALTFTLALVDLASRTALSGAAVYAWHCDAEGRYSMYSDGVTEENYLRGVLEADANGMVTFQSVFPGCYQGRWPHIHFEVYENLDAAGDGANAIKVSQLAFPQNVCEAAYTDDRYPGSAEYLGQLSLATDGVFADDQAAQQLAVVAGSNDAGYVANLPVGI
jgi:protocatechuate 3,4-dioxygenase beta subunit